jgi:hypothetical protein
VSKHVAIVLVTLQALHLQPKTGIRRPGGSETAAAEALVVVWLRLFLMGVQTICFAGRRATRAQWVWLPWALDVIASASWAQVSIWEGAQDLASRRALILP